MNRIFERLDGVDRVVLQRDPTPLDRLDRLSDRLGIDLWIKRDDLTGLGFGGNKIRQLEFYFGAAVAAKADTVLITGAVQSNFVRCAAAAAAKLGLSSILQLEERVDGMGEDYRQSGNVLLGQILGAEYMHYPVGEDENGADNALYARAEALAQEGRKGYVIPLGPNNRPLGALGYMRAAREIQQSGQKFDAVVVASGSGHTHIGLLAGMRALGDLTPVYGSCVRRDAGLQRSRIEASATKIAGLLGEERWIDDGDIQLWDGALMPGYGKMGAPAREALLMMAREEGLFLDPVYTAKSFAAVPGLLDDGVLQPGMSVLYIHTGGLPGIFAYRDRFEPVDLA